MQVNDTLSQDGLRVLAFAMRQLPEVRELKFEDEAHFTFVDVYKRQISLCASCGRLLSGVCAPSLCGHGR